MNVGVGDAAKDFILSHSKWLTAAELETKPAQHEHADSALDV